MIASYNREVTGYILVWIIKEVLRELVHILRPEKMIQNVVVETKSNFLADPMQCHNIK